MAPGRKGCAGRGLQAGQQRGLSEKAVQRAQPGRHVPKCACQVVRAGVLPGAMQAYQAPAEASLVTGSHGGLEISDQRTQRRWHSPTLALLPPRLLVPVTTVRERLPEPRWEYGLTRRIASIARRVLHRYFLPCGRTEPGGCVLQTRWAERARSAVGVARRRVRHQAGRHDSWGSVRGVRGRMECRGYRPWPGTTWPSWLPTGASCCWSHSTGPRKAPSQAGTRPVRPEPQSATPSLRGSRSDGCRTSQPGPSAYDAPPETSYTTIRSQRTISTTIRTRSRSPTRAALDLELARWASDAGHPLRR